MARSHLARLLLLCLGAACGPPVPGVARVLNGATPGVAEGARGPSAPMAPLADGDWRVSPNRVEVDFREIVFYDTDGGEEWIALTDCSATYDRDEPSLSRRLDCDFEVPSGTYGAVGLTFDPTVRVLIDEPTIGLYTNGDGVQTTPPSGGAVPSPVVSVSPGNRATLAEPLVVEDEPVAIQVVMSGLYTVGVSVDGTTARLAESFGVQIYVTPSAVGATSYYSTSDSALSTTDAGVRLVLFYEDPATPSYAFLTPGSDIAVCGGGGEGTYQAHSTSPGELDESGQTIGGYLALDDTGTLCFALPTDPTWRTYQAMYRMRRADTVGDPTTLECVQTSEVPSPASGSNWSSGCPSFTPDAQSEVRLIAE